MSRFVVYLAIIALTYNISTAGWDTTGTGALPPVNAIFALADKVYAGSNVNGVFVSITKGVQWIERLDGLTQKAVWTITASGNSVYAGTNEGGVYKSTDMGGRWTQANNGLGSLYIYAMLQKGTDLFAGCDGGGIFKSGNNGTSWVSVNSGIIENSVYALAATATNLYVGTALGGLFMTTDNGGTWKDIGGKTFKEDIKCIAAEGSRVLVGTKNTGVFFSPDEGKTWSSVNTGLRSAAISSIVIRGNNIYLATKDAGIFFSNNNGTVWVEANEDLPEYEVLSLATDGEYLFAGLSSWINGVVRRPLSDIKFPEVQPPVLVFPDKDAINIDTAVTFKWNSSNGAVSYNIQLSDDPGFNNIIQNRDGIKALFFPFPGLLKNKTYYWKVAANTSDNEKKWSEAWKFETKAELLNPVLSFPPNDTTNLGIPFYFKWFKTSGAVSYILHITDDATFDSILVSVTDIPDTTYLSPGLKEFKQYYWRLASEGFDGSKLWSDVHKFMTGKSVGVEEISENQPFRLVTYPNPANDYVQLDLDLHSNGSATIQLYNITGELIEELFSGETTDGKISLRFDIQEYCSGIYYLSVKSKGYSINRMLEIIR
jgi:ligand-binding sensor domain-containing protein